MFDEIFVEAKPRYLRQWLGWWRDPWSKGCCRLCLLKRVKIQEPTGVILDP
jgi:hypothetical protein